MRPLRFCLVASFYPPFSFGGDAVFVRELARLLVAHGHEVTVVHSREAYFAVGGTPVDHEPPEEEGIEVVSVDAGHGLASPLATYLTGRPLLVRGALERVLGRGYDVIHFHNPSLVAGPGGLALGEARVRLMTLHEQWLVCPTHVFFKFQRELCEKRDCVRCTISHRRPPQLWRYGSVLERSLAQVDALLAPSRSTAKLHRRLAGVVPIEHLPSFVPDPGPPGARGSGGPFLYAGRLEPVKGVGTLIEAFRERPDDELVIAGSGSESDALRRAAAGAPNVRFTGWLEQDELDALYRRAKAVLVPTLGHESFPLVVLEALARGTPAIVRRRGALAEVAAESGAALTFASQAELHACLDRLRSDDELRAALGDAGRAAYEQRWTPAAHMDAYLALVERLSHGAPAPAPVAA